MKRILDRTNKAATKQTTSVQPFAGGILNKYKAGARRNNFGRLAMSHVMQRQPNVIQQSLHVQVVAPKDAAPNKKKPLPSPERKVERIIEHERVTVERETIVFRDVTHVIKEQRTVREIAISQPVGVLDINDALQRKKSALSEKPSEVIAGSNKDAVNRVLQKRTIPQASLIPVQAMKDQQADYYKWLQAKLQPGIVIQSIRKLEMLRKPLAKERVHLMPPIGKHSPARQSPLLLTSARRVVFREEQLTEQSERASKEIANSIHQAGKQEKLEAGKRATAANKEQRELVKRSEAVRQKQQEAERRTAAVDKEQREASKRSEAVRQEQQEAERRTVAANKEQRELVKRSEAVRQEQKEAEKRTVAAIKEQREASKRSEAVRQEQKEADSRTAAVDKVQSEASKRSEAVRQEQQEAERRTAAVDKEQRELVKRSEAVRQEQQEAEKRTAAVDKEQRDAVKRSEAARQEQQEAERRTVAANKEQRSEAVRQEQQEADSRTAAANKEQQRSEAAGQDEAVKRKTTAGSEQKEALPRTQRANAQTQDESAWSQPQSAKGSRLQKLEHRSEGTRFVDQTEASKPATVHLSEANLQANASGSKIKAVQHLAQQPGTGQSGQSSIKITSNHILDQSRNRLQLQRKPQLIALQKEQSSGKSSSAIAAKRLIHRTQRPQAGQPFADDNKYTAYQKDSSRTAYVKPSNRKAAAVKWSEAEQLSGSGQTSGTSSIDITSAKGSLQPKEKAYLFRNKGTEGTAAAQMKAIVISQRHLLLKKMQLSLRHFNLRQSRQHIDEGLTQNGNKGAESSFRRALPNVNPLSLKSQNENQFSNHNHTSRSRRAIVHKRASLPLTLSANDSPNDRQAYASSAGVTKEMAEAKNPLKPASAKPSEPTGSLSEIQRSVTRGQLVARASSEKTTKVIRTGVMLSHTRLDTPDGHKASRNAANHTPAQRKSSAAAASEQALQTPAGAAVGLALHAARRTNRHFAADSPQREPGKTNRIMSGLIQRAADRAGLAEKGMANPAANNAAQLKPHLTRRALSSTGENETEYRKQSAGMQASAAASRLTGLAVSPSAAPGQIAAAARSHAASTLVQRAAHIQSQAENVSAAAVQRTADSTLLPRGASKDARKLSDLTASKAAASMRAYPVVRMQKSGPSQKTINGHASRLKQRPQAVNRGKGDSPSLASTAAGVIRIHRQTAASSFLNRSSAAGAQWRQTVQLRSGSGRSIGAAPSKGQEALTGLTTVVQAGDERFNPAQTAGAANEHARLSYAAAGSNRKASVHDSFGGQGAGSSLLGEQGTMPMLSHHKLKQAAVQEPPRQVQVDAPRELDPEKLQKMIMKMPQLHPEAIADQVYKALERKMKLEQRRRGF